MKKKYTLDESAFDIITEQSAYWIGFLMADGCITKKQNTVYLNLRINEDDIDHIKKFRAFLQSSHRIGIYTNKSTYKSKKNLACLSVASSRLVRAVAQYGVVPRKSHIAEVKHLENNHDFWRGMIDGDGWLYTTFNRLPAIGLCGSEKIVKQFEVFVKKNTECRSHSRKKKNKKNHWLFQTSGQPAQQIIELLYNRNILALDRKDIIAQSMITMPFSRHQKDRSAISLKDLKSVIERDGWKTTAVQLGIAESTLRKLVWRKQTGKH